MKLKEFIEKFVEKNTLIRLWYKIKGGHKQIDGETPTMEWALVKGKYKNREVVGVTDILVLHSQYAEAVNIVIK